MPGSETPARAIEGGRVEEREAGDAIGLNSDSAPLCPVVSPPDSPTDRGERVQNADALEEEEEDICEHDLRFMDCSKCLPPLVGPTGSVLALVCFFLAAPQPFQPPSSCSDLSHPHSSIMCTCVLSFSVCQRETKRDSDAPNSCQTS